MSNFITVPMNANGMVFDTSMNAVVAEAVDPVPFAFEDIFVYSHGWSTDADRALDLYNQFSIGLSKQVLFAANLPLKPFVSGPRPSLGIGVHWPSEVTEDPNSPLNELQLFSFFTMEHRAEAVGKNGVYSMLRLLLTNRAGKALPVRLFPLGHSFGCKVICAALNDLQVDIANKTIPVPANLSYRVVLLQGATDHDNLEPGDIYGSVHNVDNLRMLVTKSDTDLALGKWYLDASKLANLFHAGAPTPALGSAGPTVATATAFGGSELVIVEPGYSAVKAIGEPSRLIIADLTPIHKARLATEAYNGGLSGSHSDINFVELYQLVLSFLYS